MIELIVVIVVGFLVMTAAAAIMKFSLGMRSYRLDRMGTALRAEATAATIRRLVGRAVEDYGPPVPPAGSETVSLMAAGGGLPANRGIHFLADTDDNGRLEWVWIWHDATVTSNLLGYPYTPRYPIKVAIFDRYETNYNQRHALTDGNDSLYDRVNADPSLTEPRAYTIIGMDAAQWRFSVSGSDVEGPGNLKRAAQLSPMVTVNAGFFVDRSSTNSPWSMVAPGAFNVAGNSTPTYTRIWSIPVPSAQPKLQTAGGSQFGKPAAALQDCFLPTNNRNRIYLSERSRLAALSFDLKGQAWTIRAR